MHFDNTYSQKGNIHYCISYINHQCFSHPRSLLMNLCKYYLPIDIHLSILYNFIDMWHNLWLLCRFDLGVIDQSHIRSINFEIQGLCSQYNLWYKLYFEEYRCFDNVDNLLLVHKSHIFRLYLHGISQTHRFQRSLRIHSRHPYLTSSPSNHYRIETTQGWKIEKAIKIF